MTKTSEPEPPSTGAPRGKIFYGWWVVLSAAVGLFMCYGPVVTFTFGIFFNQLAETFQWSRGEISAAYSLAMLSLRGRAAVHWPTGRPTRGEENPLAGAFAVRPRFLAPCLP